MNDLITQIKEQFDSNQFLQGGFILGVISAIAFWGRGIFSKAWGFIYSMFFINVTADSTDLFYHCLQKWINHEGITKNKRWAQIYIDDKTDPPTVWYLADRVKYLTRRAGFWAAIAGKKISPADLVGHIQAHSMHPDLDLILDVDQFILDCMERRKIMIQIKEESAVELEQKEKAEDEEDDEKETEAGKEIDALFAKGA